MEVGLARRHVKDWREGRGQEGRVWEGGGCEGVEDSDGRLCLFCLI